MQKKIRGILTVGSIALLLLAIFVIADTESTTVTWVIPSQVDHSIAYGEACSSANFYFVENDAVIDGTQAKLNLTSDSAGVNLCQTNDTAGMVISNVGSVNINITANMSTVLPAGVGLKAANASDGYEVICSGVSNSTACVDIIFGAAVIIANDIPAQIGTKEVYLWGNMTNFNAGIAGSDTETLETHSHTD